MKIPTISDWLYRAQHDRVYWLTQAERKRAIKLTITLFAIVAFGVLTWVLYR